MDCPSGANAKSWNACDQMCAKAKQYRTDKNADEKRKEENAKEKNSASTGQMSSTRQRGT